MSTPESKDSQSSFPPVKTEDPIAEPRSKAYPIEEPFDEGFLQVSDIHSLYYEQSGNKEGQPVVVLHGGPGGGCPPGYRSYFNPKKYRIILFDQRGAGKSLPFAELKDNTTWDLVSDIEKLRAHLKIDKWVVFGGSWGSTLSLSYAQTHPDRVKALILRGIFTLRRDELIWFYQEGASWLFPDHWEDYIAPIPPVERGDLMSAYYRRLTGNNEEEKLRCARSWTRWEMATSRLIIDPKNLEKGEDDKFALAFSRIECHYFVHGGWFKEEGQLIKNASVLSKIPATIVQGRYDVVCPPKTAWDLHKSYPEAEFYWVADAGHSMAEDGVRSVLLKAADKYQDL